MIYLSVSKDVVAMSMRGLVLITVCVANVLTAKAECCNCDCQQPALLHQPHLYYLPVASTHLSSTGHGYYQNLGQVSVQGGSQYAQSIYNAGYQTAGGTDHQYNVQEQENENSLDAGSKSVQSGRGEISLNLNNQQPSIDYKGQAESSVTNDNLKQQQISKVSTAHSNHYIKIEQQVSPHDSSSGEDVNSLEHQKDDHHHHGKNDHYKFEYGVNDQHTHDIKSHKEEKNGDVVRGEYSLLEDNGNVRTVKYYADWKTGFHAQVLNSKSAALG